MPEYHTAVRRILRLRPKISQTAHGGSIRKSQALNGICYLCKIRIIAMLQLCYNYYIMILCFLTR